MRSLIGSFWFVAYSSLPVLPLHPVIGRLSSKPLGHGRGASYWLSGKGGARYAWSWEMRDGRWGGAAEH
jgi:hypothetical protein